MLRLSRGYDPLLRRPFSLHTRQGEGFSLLYRIVGRGTGLMSTLRPGDRLDVLGPLGTGFRLPDQAKTAVLVGGGVGVAPLPFLAEALAARGCRIVSFIGGAAAGDILACNELERFGPVQVATEDGSLGRRGLVTEILAAELSAFTPPVQLFACGPREMLAEVASFAARHGFPCQVSLDEVLACGMGACQGCVVETVAGWRRVCCDGPVFEAQEVIWKG